MVKAQYAELLDLEVAEKLQLLEDLWDSIAANPEAVPVHKWQEKELARRDAKLRKSPESAIAWEEARRRIRARHGRNRASS